MRNILDELWYGNITPFSQCKVNTPEMKELAELITRHNETLDKALSAEQKEVFEKYHECMDELNSKFIIQAFKYGFRLGSRLTADALSPKPLEREG